MRRRIPVRRNSQLAYPPAMEDAFVQKLRELMPLIDRKLAKAREAKRDPPDPIVQTMVPLDLTGMADHYPKKAMMAAMPSVPLYVRDARSGGGAAGTWTYAPRHQQRLTLYVRPGEVVDVQRLRGTLRHELRHMVQSVLENALRKGHGQIGIPNGEWALAHAAWRRDLGRAKQKAASLGRFTEAGAEAHGRADALGGKWGPSYYLNAVEYYPHLGNIKDRLAGGGSGEARFGRGTEIPLDKLRRVLASDQEPLLAALRAYGPDLYRKAAGDLTRWVQDHNAAVRAARDGRPITTARILSDLQDRLDRDNPSLALELRANRARYEAQARSLVTG
jgi:hypothetical protein